MELYKIRGGNKEDLENKKYTLSVGISLGNKWFTTENVIELIKWSLQNSKDDVIVYIGDSIHAINLEIKKRTSYEKALLMAEQMGNDFLEQLKAEMPKHFSPEEALKIIFAKWNDLVDDLYKNKVNYLYKLYTSNNDFKNLIENIATEAVINGERKYSPEEIHRLGDYVIEELPHQLNRVQIKGFLYDALVYPFDGKIPELVEKIQKGEVFPEIKENIMDTEPKVFMEVR
ncbi:MAG: hypothetical protein A3A90_00070 [Candidatus Zambryskibacteria bacterium RIFCSPLOWO2_01_FULL_35_19]|uniref:Cyclodipeptide synthase n=1 Tax=Candidatus Zambryskibacteria bacterium RIFCSPLOWO2_01_FULL_35_19 TaxID=1802757 RepID=A0A1G2TXE3_9BACT|nr:MAG: hypothetical protein A2726_00560 [Candidatus Zambryskibacteria bacterium RIFCSPHIGHO2_01_FULL_35_32]OHB01232.1 MAG: hypothetical protein A3A90_00070 [Candidatus Zambryskibacteria bacterium RIFCSPLOWO2_01_FULL_35_19]